MDSDLRQKDELFGTLLVGGALCHAYFSVDSDLRQKDELFGTLLVGGALCRAYLSVDSDLRQKDELCFMPRTYPPQPPFVSLNSFQGPKKYAPLRLPELDSGSTKHQLQRK